MFLILMNCKLAFGHRKWFLNTNLFLVKPFLITKFDCSNLDYLVIYKCWFTVLQSSLMIIQMQKKTYIAKSHRKKHRFWSTSTYCLNHLEIFSKLHNPSYTNMHAFSYIRENCVTQGCDN